MSRPWIQMATGVKRQTIAVGERLHQMVVHFEPGTVLPPHQHENEQVTYVVSGKITMLIAGQPVTLVAGDSVLLPSNVPHGVRVDEPSVVLDTFNPPRADLLAIDEKHA